MGESFNMQQRLVDCASSSINSICALDAAEILNQFPTLFDRQRSPATMSLPAVAIPLKTEAKPKYIGARSVPVALLEKFKQEIDMLVKRGTLIPVDYSKWASPVVLVLKTDSSIRICGDYKATLNKQIEAVEYALPRAEDIFNRLNGCAYFSKLDLSSAYNQLSLDEEAQTLTTISTPFGLFKYTVLPFGIATAPAIFQRTMDYILRGMDFVFGYLDDIVVGGATEQEHNQRLKQVLERLGHHNVILNREKCVVGLTEIEYLGHKLSRKGIQPTQGKVTAITQAEAPTNVKTLRAFLGLINYYGKFLPNLASTLSPLSDLTKKDNIWHWEEKHAIAFQDAKNKLSTSTVLVHYSPTLPLIVSSDASNVGLGAILAHKTPGGGERPVAYTSRKLSPAERNYSQVEKEGLAVIYSLNKFHYYLFGRQFTI